MKGSLLGLLLIGSWGWHTWSLAAVSATAVNFPSAGLRLLYIHLLQKIQTLCSIRDISFTSAYTHGRLTYSLSLLTNCAKLSQAWFHPQNKRLALLRDMQSCLVFIWIDLALGILGCFFLYTYSGSVIDFTHRQQHWFMQKFLFDAFSWIREGPVGIKLNHTLTRMMEKVLGMK